MPGPRTGFLELKSLPQVCKSICLPADQGPIRLPTYPAVERTSVLSFNATTTINVPANGRRGLLFRHSTMPLWLESESDTPYTWCAVWDLTSSNHGDFMVKSDPRYVKAGNFSGVLGYTVTGSGQFPGPCPIGELEAKPYLFAGKDCFYYFVARTGASATASGPIQVVYEVVTMGGGLETRSESMLGTSFGYSSLHLADESCFVRPIRLETFGTGQTPFSITLVVTSTEVLMTGTPGPTGTVTIATVPTSGPHVARVMLPTLTAPAMDVSLVPFSNTRVTACAALFTNVTKALNKEGTIMAGRFNPIVQNVFDVGPVDYAKLTPMEKYFYGLEGGFYTYTPLATNVEEFSDDVYSKLETNTDKVTASYPVLHLARNSMVNCFQFSDPDGGTALAVNLDWHVEFRNSSVLWPVAISAMSLEQAHQAQLVLLETGFFFDNVNHQKILGYVSSALQAIKPILKSNPVGAAIYGGAKMAVKSYSSYITPKPSTLQAAMPKPTVRKPKEKKVKVKVNGKKEKKKAKK